MVANKKVVAAIANLKGKALVKPVGTRKFSAAYKGQMIKNGDVIKTPKKVFMSIVFLDGSNIKIQQETELRVTSYRRTAKELATTLDLARGEAYSDIASQGSDGEFTVKTPTAVAAVKGTELNVDFNEDSEETSLVVTEGSVEFYNPEFPDQAQSVGAGEGSTLEVGQEAPSEPEEVPEDELPTWQNDIAPEYGFILKPDKTSRQPVNQVVKVSVGVVSASNKEDNNTFQGTATFSTESENLLVSADKSSWASSASIGIENGKGLFYLKGVAEGTYNVVGASDEFESAKVSVDYFQSQSQKKKFQDKFTGIVTAKGRTGIVDAIGSKSLKSSKITSGQGSIDDILQKLESGEYEIIEAEPITNPDGSVTVKIKAKPKK